MIGITTTKIKDKPKTENKKLSDLTRPNISKPKKLIKQKLT